MTLSPAMAWLHLTCEWTGNGQDLHPGHTQENVLLMLDMGLWYRGGILAERSLCPSRFGKSNIQEPSLSSHTKINQLDFLIISLQHSGCAAKLSWSTDFVFPPIYTGTSKTGYNIPPRLGAARAFSFVKTDRCKIRPQSRAKRMGSHRIPVLLSKFSASQIAKAWNKMNLYSPVRSEGHLDRMQRRAGVMDQGAVLNKKHPRKQSHLARSKGTVPLYTQYGYSSKTLSKVHINFSSKTRNLHVTALFHESNHFVKMSFWESLSVQSPFLTSIVLWKHLQQVPAEARVSLRQKLTTATLHHQDFNFLLHRMPLAQAFYCCLRNYCVNYHCKHQLKKWNKSDCLWMKRKEKFSFLGGAALSRVLIPKTFSRK